MRLFSEHLMPKRDGETTSCTSDSHVLSRRDFMARTSLIGAGLVVPFTLAIAQLAYEGDEGPELAYRIERFGK
jgi:hypothetical protein